jgi:glycosyltransferase involved in cell wall biosynthesis
MKILVLIHEFPPIGGGGGRVAQDICQSLVARGHEVQILTAHLKDLPRQEVIGGIQVTRLPSGRKYPFRAGLLEMAGYVGMAILAGWKTIREWKPNLIHVHFAVPAGVVAWILSRLTGVPYVLTAHLGDVPDGVPEKTGGWFRWVYPFTPPIWRGAARAVAVSEFTRSLALKHYPVPVKVIFNGVDLASLPAWQPPSDGVPRIVFAGRFVPQKNPEHIVDVLSKLGDLPWTCTLLGNGPLFDEVQQRITRSGLQERFHLPGWVTPNDVLDWFSRSDILVLPSRSEGLSVVGVQALAMGLALALSNAGGNVELVEDGKNGLLFEPGDLERLEAGLRTLLADRKALAAAQAHSRQMAKNFEIEHVVDLYESLFEEVVSFQ